MKAVDRQEPRSGARATGPPLSRRRHLETLACGWRGHVCPAADVASFEGPLLLGIHLGDEAGNRLCRCLRCGLWVEAPSPPSPVRERLPAPEDIELPRRGHELRQAVVMRLIAVERGIHSAFFALVAVLAVMLRSELSGVKSGVRHLLGVLTANSNGTGTAIGGQGFLVQEGHSLLSLRSSTLNVVIAAAVAYCVVEGVEAVGLWRERRWAEYLTVVATAGFIPYEVYELVRGVSVLKVGAFVVNVVVLAYLLWSKELFGVGRWRHRRRTEVSRPAWHDFLRP